MGSPTGNGYRSFGLNISTFGGGWVENLINSIVRVNGVKVFSLFYADFCSDLSMKELDGVSYIALPVRVKGLTRCNKEMIEDLKQALNLAKPDVIHIIGTEREHNLRLAEQAGFEKTVCSITGMASICEKHYFGGIDIREFSALSIGDIYRHGGPVNERKQFRKYGEFEKQLLTQAKYVMGRTTWDYACTKQLNPDIQYYYCSEILNPIFLENRWTVENCDRHRMFISQASYPIKGFHKVLEALPLILKRYPDTEIYIAGPDILKADTWLSRIKRTTYSYYIEKLIRKLNLDMAKIHFTGSLPPREMVQQYLKCNVFVLPSAIENSPNSLGEAMSLGVPCVASCVGGVQDMLRDKIDGFIYPFNESYMLAHYVCEIFTHESLAVGFSNNALENARKRFDPEQVKKTTLDVYKYIYEHSREDK